MRIKNHFLQIVFGLACLGIGTILILPTQAATKSSIYATKKWTKQYAHSKSQCKNLFYTKSEVNDLFYTKTNINTLLGNYYSKTDSDARYYTQSQITSNYYNKTDSDNRYVNTSGDSLTTTGITYSPAITKTVSVNAAALKPERSVIFDFADDKGLYLVSGNAEYDDDFGRASIILPDGALVTKLTGYFYDNDGGANTINASLARTSFIGTTDTMAAVQNSGAASPGYENATDTSISYATVDNSNYSYYVYSFLLSSSTNLRIKGYKIEYQITTP